MRPLCLNGSQSVFDFLSSIFVNNLVVVHVNLTAQLRSLDQTLSAYLISLVVRDVELEEAGVALGERIGLHLCHQSNLVLLFEIIAVGGQTGSTPNKLEIGSLLSLTHSLKDSPEAPNYTVVIWTIRIGRDFP